MPTPVTCEDSTDSTAMRKSQLVKGEVSDVKAESIVALGPAASLLKAIVAHIGRLLDQLLPKERGPKPEILGNPFHDRSVQKHLRKLQRSEMFVKSSKRWEGRRKNRGRPWQC